MHATLGLCAPRTLALTGTPERKDRLERVVNWLLGPMAFRLVRERQASTEVRSLRYTCERFRSPPPVNRRGDVDFTGVVTALADDAERTRVIADAAAGLARDRHVLVLSHRREHCKAIAARLVELGVEAATYLGGDASVPGTRVIVATFSLTAEGFDEPRLTGLVLATPASDVEQACGRVMRGAGPGGSGSCSSAVIVDVEDQWSVCFSQAAKRRAFYKRSGFSLATAQPPAPVPVPFDFV